MIRFTKPIPYTVQKNEIYKVEGPEEPAAPEASSSGMVTSGTLGLVT